MPRKSIKFCYTVTQRTISVNYPDFWFWTTELGPQGKATTYPKGTKRTRIQPCQGTTWPENRRGLSYVSFDYECLCAPSGKLQGYKFSAWLCTFCVWLNGCPRKQESSFDTRQFKTDNSCNILALWMLSPIHWRSGFTSGCMLLCLQSLLRQPRRCCYWTWCSPDCITASVDSNAAWEIPETWDCSEKTDQHTVQ